jgi:hypothetical protein
MVTDVTPEQRTEWRTDAKTLHLGLSMRTPADRILWLLDALDAAEARVAAAERERDEAEAFGQRVVADMADMEERSATAERERHAAEREFAERAAQALFSEAERMDVSPHHATLEANTMERAARIVRDLMPREDGE